MNRLPIPLVIFISMAALLAVGLTLEARKPSSVLIDEAVQAFELPLLHQHGVSFASSELQGQVTLLNVWASWCVTCRVEHPLLMAIARDQNLNLYGLNYKDARADALKWLDFYGNPYRLILVDESGKTGIDFGVYGVPETFIIDGKGNIRHRHIGALTQEDWEQTVLPIVKKLESEL